MKNRSFEKSELEELSADELSILAVLQKDRNILYSKQDEQEISWETI
jgi:hypothetical protein